MRDDGRRRAGLGSPAYAGIDLSGPMSRWSDWRFPRLRGDRPAFVKGNVYTIAVPPPTRG